MSSYQLQTENFMQKTGTTININFSHVGKHFVDDIKDRNIYNVEIERNGETMTVNFGDSIYNTRHNICPTPYDIVTCLTTDDPGSYDDFVDTFGYQASPETRQIYDDVVSEYDDVYRVFGDVLDELEEIKVVDDDCYLINE